VAPGIYETHRPNAQDRLDANECVLSLMFYFHSFNLFNLISYIWLETVVIISGFVLIFCMNDCRGCLHWAHLWLVKISVNCLA
jgi:hypothetical protein